jgi:hypothetical protein
MRKLKKSKDQPENPSEKDPAAVAGMPDLFPKTPTFIGKFMHTTVIVIRIKDPSALRATLRVQEVLKDMERDGIIDEIQAHWSNSKIEI